MIEHRIPTKGWKIREILLGMVRFFESWKVEIIRTIMNRYNLLVNSRHICLYLNAFLMKTLVWLILANLFISTFRQIDLNGKKLNRFFVVVGLSVLIFEKVNDLWSIFKFLQLFLVMASTLNCISREHKISHLLKDFTNSIIVN
jgi:hypothetical protein